MLNFEIDYTLYNIYSVLAYNCNCNMIQYFHDDPAALAVSNLYCILEDAGQVMSVEKMTSIFENCGADLNNLLPEYKTKIREAQNTNANTNLMIQETQEQMEQINQAFTDLHNLFGG